MTLEEADRIAEAIDSQGVGGNDELHEWLNELIERPTTQPLPGHYGCVTEMAALAKEQAKLAAIVRGLLISQQQDITRDQEALEYE